MAWLKLAVWVGRGWAGGAEAGLLDGLEVDLVGAGVL